MHAFTAAAIAVFTLFLRATRHRAALFFEQSTDIVISSNELENLVSSLGYYQSSFYCYLGHIHIAETARVQSHWHSMETDT